MTENFQNNPEEIKYQKSEIVNILLVDDEPKNLASLEGILESPDYRLIKAASGPEALKQLLNRENFALILLDVKMPGMDGFETARLIKQRDRTRDIPIIFVSAYHLEESDILQGYEFGAVDYITKPLNPTILTSKVRVFVEMHRQKEQLKKLSRAVETTLDSIVITDKEGNIEYVNPGFEQITGYTKDEVMGKNPRILKSEKQPKSFYEELWATILAGKNFHAQFINRRKNGELYYYETTITPMKNTEGGITHFVGTGRDVTDRVHAEDELAISRENFRSLIEKNMQGILIVDKEGMVRFINPAVETLMNRKKEDILNQLFGFPLTDGTLEININRTGGEIGAAEIRVDKTDWQGEECSMISILDIAERKHSEEERQAMEAELRQAHKMEAIGTMAGGIAHDLNNMLVPIMGYTEMEQKKLDPDSRIHGNLGKVLKSAKRARDLVSQILLFSRKGEAKKTAVSFKGIIDEIHPILQSMLPSTISIQLEVASGLPKILADTGQIQQILLYMCVNAGQSMPDGGSLSISVDKLGYRRLTTAYGEKTEGNYVCLSVRDSGQGMDAETLERVFDPFFTTKEEGEGTGLGLSVVQGIVEQHEGTISVESEPGKGSEFRICLPYIEKNRENAAKVESQTNLHGNERILFVDDDEQVYETWTMILKELGYQVTSFMNSSEALDVFLERPREFDLVITDYTMPHMTGIRLTEELRAVRPDIPVILITGYTDNVSASNIHQWGINEMVMKPFEIPSLSQTIRRVLAQSGKDGSNE